MPAIGFVCPDKERIRFEDCLKKCRLEADLPCGRCKALPYLRKISRQREWTGEPSTTQLLQGTMEAYLKIEKPYYFDPESRIFMFHGTSVHWILEKFGKEGDNFNEERLRDDICSGAFDFYDGDQQILYDYKTWGSYKVAQALGIKKIEDVPVLDEKGSPVLLKSGPNKGKVKTHTLYEYDDLVTRGLALLDTSIQLSNYRDKLLTILPEGYAVKKMAVQVISRDAGLMVSKMRKIEVNAPVIPINGVSKRWVDRYMRRKRELLLEALETKKARVCSVRERWAYNKNKVGRKCKSFCDVRGYCPNYKEDKWK